MISMTTSARLHKTEEVLGKLGLNLLGFLPAVFRLCAVAAVAELKVWPDLSALLGLSSSDEFLESSESLLAPSESLLESESLELASLS